MNCTQIGSDYNDFGANPNRIKLPISAATPTPEPQAAMWQILAHGNYCFPSPTAFVIPAAHVLPLLFPSPLITYFLLPSLLRHPGSFEKTAGMTII